MSAPPLLDLVGVVGAGTMGAGIAQIAAAAGHTVHLYDVRSDAAQLAHDQIASALNGLVGKGRMSETDRSAILQRIIPVGSLADFSAAAMVVEVIVENLQAKQTLLRELERHVSPQAVLASNTSSISITALANGMQHPERIVGMHFFNPVPLMKLVEVVSGADTSPQVAARVAGLARSWGKQPVQAKSTPGFIVNRIARPFYAEALLLLQEQAGTPQQLDTAMKSAGFRMGPCELMDLIGHDVNYAVTTSMYEANYFDKRYVPSLVQKELLDAGRLGRKSGRGFYRYPLPVAPDVGTAPLPGKFEVVGDGAFVANLLNFLSDKKIAWSRVEEKSWSGLRIGAVQLPATDGRSAAQMRAELGIAALGVLDLPLLSASGSALCIAYAPGVNAAQKADVAATLAGCGLQVIELRDVPGLIVARTIAMLINEACDAVYQGVCDEQGADIAMKLATNYPAGPFEWLNVIGVDYTVNLLNNLFAAYRSERYRVSPLLQQRYWKSR